MTRIEKQEDIKEELSKIKGGIAREVRQTQRAHGHKLTCSVVFLLFIFAVILLVGWVVAGTGLVRVPLLTSLAYDKPEPTRVVESGVFVEDVAKAEFYQTLTERVQSGNGALLDRSVKIRISEESLTASLRSVLEETGMEFFDPTHSQVIVQEDDIFVLFLPLKDNPQQTAVQVYLGTSVLDGKLEVILHSVEMGSVSVPSFVVTRLLEPVSNAYLADLNRALAPYASVSGVEYHEGWLEISGEFAVELQNGSTL